MPGEGDSDTFSIAALVVSLHLCKYSYVTWVEFHRTKWRGEENGKIEQEEQKEKKEEEEYLEGDPRIETENVGQMCSKWIHLQNSSKTNKKIKIIK